MASIATTLSRPCRLQLDAHAGPSCSGRAVPACIRTRHTSMPRLRHASNKCLPMVRRCVRAQAGMEVAQLSDLASTLEQLTYDAGRVADSLVAQQLTGVTPATYLAVLLAGLLTSLSPCTLSVLPLTIGYIGGYADSTEPAANAAGPGEGAAGGGKRVAASAAGPAVLFSLGLATTLAGLGVVSTSLGQAYGQIGDGLPLLVAAVAIIMGLNLLEVIQLRLPSLDVDVRTAPLPPAARAYLAGMTFALAASPCSTPVLATLLAYVSTSEGSAVEGASLLLLYSVGYVVPLLLAATFTGSLKQLLSLRQYSAWITPASGVLLVGGGSYVLLQRLLPYLQG